MAKRDEKDIEIMALEGAATDVVQRYGKAIKEHLDSYDGNIENSKEKYLTSKGVSILNTKNSDSASMQKSCAGYAAEIKSVAKHNADMAIRGENVTYTRTDDMHKQSDMIGNQIGGKNEPLYDRAMLDAEGNYIKWSGTQIKFRGKNGKECSDLFLHGEFDKYIEKNVPIEIPSDFYDDTIKYLTKEKSDIAERISEAKKNGDKYLEEYNQELLAKLEKAKIEKSNVSSKEAMFAAKHPGLSVARDVISNANRAGVAQAEFGAVFTGLISMVKNIVAYSAGEIEGVDAAKNIAIDTGEGVAVSYITAFSGSIIEGFMINSTNKRIVELSNTNLASNLVSTISKISEVVKGYCAGKLNSIQCVEKLSKEGLGSIGSAMYSSLAVASVGGVNSATLKMLAGMAGSTFGYSAAVAVYEELISSIRECHLAHENRIQIEAECDEIVNIIIQYREEMNERIEKYMSGHYVTFVSAFDAMDQYICKNDSDGYIEQNVKLQEYLGKNIQFRNQEEFDDLMDSDETFKL